MKSKIPRRTKKIVAGISALLLLFVPVLIFVAMRPGSHESANLSEFVVHVNNDRTLKGVVATPALRAAYPLVIYAHEAASENRLFRESLLQMAGLGLVVVSFDYEQNSSVRLDENLAGVLDYARKLPFVQSNAIACVESGPGVAGILSCILTRPDCRPKLAIQLVGSSASKVDVLSATGRDRALTSPQCPMIFVLSGNDDPEHMAGWQTAIHALAAAGIPATVQTLPSSGFDAQKLQGPVLRAAAECCAKYLPVPDFTAGLFEVQLSTAEKQRFNVAMQRAGQNRDALWNGLMAVNQQKRHTMLTVIGGLEDYDLAHITASHLKHVVDVAWRARQRYPWCRDLPLSVFEKYTAAPRAFSEPLEDDQPYFYDRLACVLKYCGTTAEASDAIWDWRRQRANWTNVDLQVDLSPKAVLANEGSTCRNMVVLYTKLARSAGLATRPVWTVWPVLEGNHFWSEVWDVEEKKWHAVDSSTSDRPYGTNWVLRVPKAAIEAVSGERGAWNAIEEERWPAFTNTVESFYPSGHLLVRVIQAHGPKREKRLFVEARTPVGMVVVAGATTDENGEARIALGQSARWPYRVALDGSGERDWQWLAVEAGHEYTVTLNVDAAKPFDPSIAPPALGFPEWRSPQSKGAQ